MAADTRAKLAAAVAALEEERLRTPHGLRLTGEFRHPEQIPARLLDFFREDGKLDVFSQRIHDSSIKVWRKLHAHLRELERRNTRIEDVRQRLVEMAMLPENATPRRFMREVLAPAVRVGDPNFWDDYEKADPPQPRRRSKTERQPPKHSLRPKTRVAGPVVSLEQARLERLCTWMTEVLGRIDENEGRRLSQGAFTEIEDFYRIMDVCKAGLLGRGRRLRRVGYSVVPDAGHEARVELDDRALSFAELNVTPACPGDGSEGDTP